MRKMSGRWAPVMLAASLAVTLVLAGCGGGGKGGSGGGGSDITAGDVAKGQQVFASTCSTCHGADARGLIGSGKDLVASEWVKAQSNQQLLDFLKVGRTPDDPLNTTGVLMPPKGGNPALQDGDLLDVIAYLRSLQQ